MLTSPPSAVSSPGLGALEEATLPKNRKQITREPNGRHSRQGEEKLPAPAAIARLRDAALKGAADSRWGTSLGQLFLRGMIDPHQMAAGQKWAEKAALYLPAIGAPAPHPRSASLEGASRAEPPDPDSEIGQKIAKRESKAVTAFLLAHSVLITATMDARRLSGRALKVEEAVRSICERGDWPVGQDGVDALRLGLDALVSHWSLTGSRK